MTMLCTCNAQLQPHRRIEGVCPEKFHGMPLFKWAWYGELGNVRVARHGR